MSPKYLSFILAALMAFSSVPANAESFIVLEALIQNHKTLSNRLKERVGIETGVLAATTLVEENTDDYQDIIKTMQNRVEGSFANVHFAADLAVLTMMAVKTAQKSSDAVDLALDKVGDNPLLIPATAEVVNRSGQCISNIYKLVSMVATAGTGVVLATNEDRTQFCFMIRSNLLEIQHMMAALTRMAITEPSIFNQRESPDVARIQSILQGSQDGEAKQMAAELIDRAISGL